MLGLYQDLIAFQREIYLAFADRIDTFSRTGDWTLLARYLPMGILFGIAHALTPGHSKILLASYLAGSTSSLSRGLLTAAGVAFTHVGVSVVIVLAGLPLVAFGFGADAGRAPILEYASRGLLGLIGLWMLWQALRPVHAHRADTPLTGVLAGLIPCPLTLFVMTFAVTRGVPLAGLAFAATMLVGIAAVLGLVALAAVFGRSMLLGIMQAYPRTFDWTTRGVQVVAGLVLLMIASNTLIQAGS